VWKTTLNGYSLITLLPEEIIFFYEMRNAYSIFVGQSERKNHVNDIVMYGTVLLKRIVNK
jgi:hypothetical protein